MPRISLDYILADEMSKSSLLLQHLAVIITNFDWLPHLRYHVIVYKKSQYIYLLSDPLNGNKL